MYQINSYKKLYRHSVWGIAFFCSFTIQKDHCGHTIITEGQNKLKNGDSYEATFFFIH